MNFFFRSKAILLLPFCLWLLLSPRKGAAKDYDLVIYGGTSAGVAAAVQAKRMGRSAVVIEPTHRLGGLTTGGLGKTDLGAKGAIGGISLEFYQAIKKYYDKPEAWKWEAPKKYRDEGATAKSADNETRWTFEPHVALDVFNEWVKSNGIEVVYGERLNRESGVKKSGTPPRIAAITMESGRTFRGRMFIDATYEGDLMAAAGVSYTVGREANSQYGETCNGVQIPVRRHQMRPGVSAYVEKGNPSSGLLPFINPEPVAPVGSGDGKIQAYCFRLCLTTNPDNRVPFSKPAGYDESWYELLLRDFEAGCNTVPLSNSPIPNKKTDTNNRSTGVSTDFVGQNYAYPEAGYAEREAIVERHRRWQEGLLWTLANNPRVPKRIRENVSRWGLAKDEFTDNGNWPTQLYIREARRMVSAYVMTQANCQGKTKAGDSVGMGSYAMDSHNTQRFVDEQGHVRNEGTIEKKGFPPYPISYRSLIPREGECANLLVPVCLSATHIAYGSIRMEPVFMILGQSTATAASQAIDERTSVQKIDFGKLRARLLSDGQVLEFAAPAK